jgi:TetR/AcrR family transcriptional regulator, regulator of cefoperazone and chloramphenicol sensitivity
LTDARRRSTSPSNFKFKYDIETGADPMKHDKAIQQRRGDGAGTRAQLLEAAGQVFAVKGFDRATGKEIAERAGANSAAINYYFGSFERLYAEVLLEAHRSTASLDEIAAVAESAGDPEQKLRRLIEIGLESLANAPKAWALKVLSREFLAPTSARRIVEDEEILPKRRLIARVIAEVLGREEDDPVVSRCCFSVLAPMIVLFVCEPQAAAESFPGCCGDVPREVLADHLHAFALAGIRAAAASRS